MLLAEVGAAFGMLGLLLVFLPLFLHAFERAVGGEQPYRSLQSIGLRVYFVAGTVAIAAIVVTLGLLGLWLRSDPLAVSTGIGLLVVTWCVVILAGLAIGTR